MEILPSNFPTL